MSSIIADIVPTKPYYTNALVDIVPTKRYFTNVGLAAQKDEEIDSVKSVAFKTAAEMDEEIVSVKADLASKFEDIAIKVCSIV